jgi:ribosomal protein S15P/S13E
VLLSVIRTAFRKCGLLLVTRSFVSLNQAVSACGVISLSASLDSKLGLAPSIPEDLYHLIKKAVAVRKHLETNRKDKDSKFRLILIESRIHRLARYYKTKQQIPPTFKYDSATASTLVT